MPSNPFNIPELTIETVDEKYRLPQMYTGFSDASWTLNPMQELLIPYIESEDNILIAAPTASGKSTAIYLYGAPALKQSKAVLYVAPYKALAEEKLADIKDPDHPWSSIPLMVVSGDHPWTKTQMDKATKAMVICVTPEALLSVLRKSSKEKTAWLSRVGTIVFDEIHLITSSGRGVVMETMVMEVADRCQDARLVGLSATVSNSEDLERWMTRLTRRPTVTVRSDYRPVKINRHFYTYKGKCDKRTEKIRTQMALRLATSFAAKKEQFMIAVWKKPFGADIQRAYRDATDVELPFHNAGVSKAKRDEIEQEYRMRRTIGIVATSTVFVGVNLPPRHLILTATHAGGDWIEVHELLQAEGRAGRPRYDDEAHAHYLVSEDDVDELMARLQQGCTVVSNFYDHGLVASHFLGAIYMGRIKTFDDFVVWFKRTLFYTQMRERMKDYSQSEIDEKVNREANRLLTRIIEDMSNKGYLVPDLVETDVYQLTKLGKIAAQTMADPYVLSELLVRLRRYALIPHPTEQEVARLWGGASAMAGGWAPPEVLNTFPISLFTQIPVSNKVAVAAAFGMMTRSRFPEVLESSAYTLVEFVKRYAGILARVKMETQQLANLSLEGFVATVRALVRRKPLLQATRDLPHTSPSEFAVLFGAGLYTVYDIRRHYELATEVLGKTRTDNLLRSAAERDHHE